MQTPDIALLSAEEISDRLEELAVLLHACVQDGASIGFVLPFDPDAARAYWRGTVQRAAGRGGLTAFAATLDGRIVGSVQLDHDTPANQPHRAEVRKLMVHPEFRRRGIARALMAAVEEHAVRLGRDLLTLDTRTGDMAEPLYASLGYRTSGVIPGYCLDTVGERLDSTTIMYKPL
jgi:ribosomal protein S18 acetylase RimI-like enzyme